MRCSRSSQRGKSCPPNRRMARSLREVRATTTDPSDRMKIAKEGPAMAKEASLHVANLLREHQESASLDLLLAPLVLPRPPARHPAAARADPADQCAVLISFPWRRPAPINPSVKPGTTHRDLLPFRSGAAPRRSRRRAAVT